MHQSSGAVLSYLCCDYNQVANAADHRISTPRDALYRYDVIYSSSGFNPHGYKAGCAFVNGTAADIAASPPAARYICNGDEQGQWGCSHDHVTSVACFPTDLYDHVIEDYSDDVQLIDTVRPSTLEPTRDCSNRYPKHSRNKS